MLDKLPRPFQRSIVAGFGAGVGLAPIMIPAALIDGYSIVISVLLAPFTVLLLTLTGAYTATIIWLGERLLK